MTVKHLFRALIAASVLSLTACGDPVMKLGEKVYNETCIACHAQGLNGAPMFGNKKMWAKRLPQGIPTLVEHASNGYGLMPAKGGNMDLSHKEITAAVTYMTAQVQ